MDGAHNGQSSEAEPYLLNQSKQQQCNAFNILAMFAFTGNSVSYIPLQYWYFATIQMNESVVPRLFSRFIGDNISKICI